jgi:hypothetical protein
MVGVVNFEKNFLPVIVLGLPSSHLFFCMPIAPIVGRILKLKKNVLVLL